MSKARGNRSVQDATAKNLFYFFNLRVFIKE